MTPYSPPPFFFQQEVLDYTRSCDRLISIARAFDTSWSDRELQMIEGYIGELCDVLVPLMKNRTHSIVHDLARSEDHRKMSKSGHEGKPDQQ
jgi:hypothetical protein